ncbi:MAG: acetyl-CoA C-acetyltransferase [Euryarchaeota archaeon]|nr:acetyl-CoA C-acetyltransferase [Euryarchaeota archaeon]
MKEVVIASASRTAVGKFGGTLKDVRAPELGAVVIKDAVRKAGIRPADVEEVIMGNVVGAGIGQNPARQALIHAGLPNTIGAFTINKVCGSGMKAIVAAVQAIKSGDAKIIVAGGMENMDLAPYLLDKARYGYRLMNATLIDAMVNDGLWDIYNNFHMGMTGEIIAEKFHVSREDADRMSLASNQKAVKAIREGRFRPETAPIHIPQKKGEPLTFDTDEGPRADTTMESLGKLRPAFKKDGIVTAGNASQISDGACAVVVMDREEAEKRGIKPLGKVRAYGTAGLAPELVMEAPIPATRKVLEMTGLKISDIDLFEHNEAFATASCAVVKELGIPLEKFNVNGGAVALGHPIGASGARIVTTLLYAMRDRGAHRGLATICLGGGNAVTMVLER